MTIKDCFKYYSTREFIINEYGKIISYIDFYDKTISITKMILRADCKRGDIILIKENNSEYCLQLLIACMLTETIAFPIDPEMPELRYKQIINNINPKIIISNQNINEVDVNNEIINVTECSDTNENCLMLYSSGTTGGPKGIIHRKYSLIESAKSFAKLSGINEHSVIYHHFPMYYMAGIFNLFLCPMISGAKIIIGPKFSSEQMFNFWTVPIKYCVNNLTLTPTMASTLAKLYKHDNIIKEYVKNIDSIICTGSYLYNSIQEEFRKVFLRPIQSCYGVTEVGGSITYMSKEDSAGMPTECVGKYSRDTNIVCNGDKNNPGEIKIKTKYMMSGYLVDGKIINSLEDGYFNTGDFGYIENMNLFVTGRKGDRIKRGGVFVSLILIENTIMSSGLVNDISVVSVEDEYWGNKILAFYTVDTDTDITNNEYKIKKYILNYLTNSEIPDKFILLDYLPKTNIGKIKKKKLIELYSNN